MLHRHSNFRWIIPNKLVGCHSPTYKQLKRYRKLGINSIVCLQTCEKDDYYNDYDIPEYTPNQTADLGYELLHISVPDGYPPTDEQMDEFIQFASNPKRIVLVHCHAGIGRTGCIVASYIGITEKLTGSQTIGRLRKIWLPYIQNPEQEIAVKNYIDKRNGNMR